MPRPPSPQIGFVTKVLTIFVAVLDVVYSEAASKRFEAQDREVSAALADAASQFKSGASEALSFANMFGVGRILGMGKSSSPPPPPAAPPSAAAQGFPGAADGGFGGSGGASPPPSPPKAPDDYTPQWPQE